VEYSLRGKLKLHLLTLIVQIRNYLPKGYLFLLTAYNPSSSDESAVRRNASFHLIFHDGVAQTRDFS
jgi:hypothetical protein